MCDALCDCRWPTPSQNPHDFVLHDFVNLFLSTPESQRGNKIMKNKIVKRILASVAPHGRTHCFPVDAPGLQSASRTPRRGVCVPFVGSGFAHQTHRNPTTKGTKYTKRQGVVTVNVSGSGVSHPFCEAVGRLSSVFLFVCFVTFVVPLRGFGSSDPEYRRLGRTHLFRQPQADSLTRVDGTDTVEVPDPFEPPLPEAYSCPHPLRA